MSETDESAAPQITTVSDASSLKALNRGPITTLFRPPSSCTATLTTQQPGYDSLLFFGHWHDPYFEASCVPLGTMKAGEIVEDPWNNYYYSPAICPQGWSTVTTFKSTIPGGIGTEVYSLGTETTAALCCPSGYNYLEKGHVCTSSVTRNQRVPYVSATYIGNGWDRGTVSTSTVAVETTIYGDGVQIWWQSSDEALLSAAAAATTSAPQTSSSSTQSTTNTPTSTPTPPAAGGLSTGAKAGIGGGVAALALIAGVAFVLLFLRRRRKEKSPATMHLLPENGGVPELGGAQPAEKYANNRPQELPVWDEPAELPGSDSHGRVR